MNHDSYPDVYIRGILNTAKTIAMGKAPSGSGVDEGRAVFQKLECSKCHGMAGRADGKSAPTLKDDYGNPIRPADLTETLRASVEAAKASRSKDPDGDAPPVPQKTVPQKQRKPAASRRKKSA